MCKETPDFECTRMEEDMDSFINDPLMVSTCSYAYLTKVFISAFRPLALKVDSNQQTPLSLLKHKFNLQTKEMHCS